MHARRFVLAIAFVCLAAACKGEDPQSPDGGGGDPPDAPPFMLCGNGIVEGTEACDDGNDDADDGCSPTCGLECGDGAVTGEEACDTAIAADSPGACPTEQTCVDDDPCTVGVVSGTGCGVVCEFATTTAPIDGDSCCPDGADGTTDNDCEAVCGNGVLEAGEACDTSIEPGLAGACPTSCNDGEDCTADALVDGGTCDAHCVAPEITTPGPDDGCCPGGATPETDPNCSTTCGDGVITGDETCDTGIPGSCPTACNDGDACTVDNLVNAGTCRAACTTTPTAPGPADTCCPAGSDLGDDPDCAPSCGDGVITPPETCDDDNDNAGDGCSDTCQYEPVAFRFTDLDIRDPHLFADVPILGCADVTNLSLFGIDGVNPMLQTSIQTDATDDDDTFLDLSVVNTFTPLVQTAGMTTAADLTFPDCTAPMASTSCTLAAGEQHTTATATNAGNGAVCLGPVMNTTNSSYTPVLVTATAPSGGTCYSANAGTVTFMLGDLPITLVDAQIGGAWFGNPATDIKKGMIRGFLTEATANATIIPDGLTGIDSIDGHPLSSLLPGGVDNCQIEPPNAGDSDTLVGTTTKGWYFYLNFEAARVSYVEQ